MAHVRSAILIATLALLLWVTKLIPDHLRALVRLHILIAFLLLLFCAAKLPPDHTRAPWFQCKRSTISQPESHLLCLPTELRTEIWRYLIPATTKLSKHQPVPQLPPIAYACRQTFHETQPIFFATTTFLFEVWLTDGAFTCQSALSVMERVVKFDPQNKNGRLHFAHRLIGKICWTHLLTWAQAVHAGGWHGQAEHWLGHCADMDVIISTLIIARKLGGMPWKEAKAVLETLPAAHDARWA